MVVAELLVAAGLLKALREKSSNTKTTMDAAPKAMAYPLPLGDLPPLSAVNPRPARRRALPSACLPAELVRPNLLHLFLVVVFVTLVSFHFVLEEVHPARHAVVVGRRRLEPLL